MANKDILWKGLLEWVFEDLLRFVFPASEKLIDWKAPLVFMDKELAALVPGSEDEMTVRAVDKLVKVRLKKRRAEACVHVEVQGRTEKQKRREFGERMFQYFRLIRGKYSEPLAAIAIYTGGDGHLFPKSYSCSLMNTRLQYNFEMVNVWEYADGELAASDNRFAWAMLIAKQALLSGKNWELRLLEKKWMIFRLLYANGLFQDRKLQGLLMFMKHYIPFDDPEISRIFEERCDLLTGKTKTMDIFEQVAQMQLEEARQEGEKQTKEAMVRELLEQSEFSDEKIAAVTKVAVKQVTAIRNQMRSR
jgi:hypothetical protein